MVAIDIHCAESHLNYVTEGMWSLHVNLCQVQACTTNQMVHLFINAHIFFIQILFWLGGLHVNSVCLLKIHPPSPFSKGCLYFQIFDTIAGAVHLR